MITNPSTSAVNLITSAQHKAADAANTIARFPIAADEVGSTDFSSSGLIKPVLSLKEAEIETSAAIKILETENKMLGAIFDATA